MSAHWPVKLHGGGGSIFDQDHQLFCGGRCHQSSQDARRSPGGDRRSECHQEAGMLSAAYEARNAESANLDRTLAKRLMDKGIRLRVFARKQMSRTRPRQYCSNLPALRELSLGSISLAPNKVVSHSKSGVGGT